MPYSKDPKAQTTSLWRWLFLLPTLSSGLQLFLLLFVFRFDTPAFYQTQDDSRNFQESMKKIYKHYIPIEDDSEFLGRRTASQSKDKELSWREVFLKPNREPLIFGLVLGIIHQTTGISSVVFFSNEIFVKGHTGNSAELAARVGTFGTGVATLLGAITAITMIKKFQK